MYKLTIIIVTLLYKLNDSLTSLNTIKHDKQRNLCVTLVPSLDQEEQVASCWRSVTLAG